MKLEDKIKCKECGGLVVLYDSWKNPDGTITRVYRCIKCKERYYDG